MTGAGEQATLIRAIQAFPQPFLVIDASFRITATNGQIPSYVSDIRIGDYCHRVMFGRDTPCEPCPARRVFDSGKAFIQPRDEPVPSDPESTACIYAYPVNEGADQHVAVIMDLRMPPQKGVEEALARSNSFLNNLLRSAVDSIIAADMTGKIVIFNEAAAEVTGFSVQEALNTLHIWDVYPDDSAREVMALLRSDSHGPQGKLKKYHCDLIGKNGERIPISLYAAVIYEHDAEVATIGFFHDLRERIRIEKELEKTQVQLLQSAKMASLGKLAAGVAHQLNNPLGGITLYAKLILEEYDLAPGAHDDMERILADAERCRDTVRELLEFARQTKQFMKPSDVNELIARTLFLLENQTLFHNITIDRAFHTRLPRIMADGQQLNHLFMNIVLNAAQAMDGHGRLVITTDAIEAGQNVRVTITDSGPGIPEAIIDHIFEPFYTTKQEGKGTGLGLSIVYGIVENHHGTIEVANNTDGGATFTITLPVADTEGEFDE